MKLKKSYGVECEVTPQKNMFGKVLGYDAKLFNFQGFGKTPDGAVADLRLQMERCSKANNGIFVAQWRGTILVANFNWEFYQWQVHRVNLHENKELFSAGWLTGASTVTDSLAKLPTNDLLADMVAKTLIEYAWKPEDGLRIPCRLSRINLPELASLLEFRLRWHAAKERGLSEQDCHDYAGRNPARPELWINEPKDDLKLVQG